ncbi:MAG: hypothetical protein RLZZ324_445 [Candidatus Parcubacteria bacterium]|jgi:antitoxin component of RelBE/YafQ-DinJ toxin-antitoxin module
MRARFEGDLDRMVELAKEKKSEEEKLMAVAEAGSRDGEVAQEKPPEKEGPIDLDTVIRHALEKAARTQGTDVDVQKRIFGIQKAKQDVMARLHERLAALDDPKAEREREPDARAASYREKNGIFRYRNDKGVESSATFADVVTDLEWGITYELDDKTPRLLRKKYEIARAKRELQEMLDAQIMQSETHSVKVDDRKRDTYARMAEDKERGLYEQKAGLLAERMVKNFFAKAALHADMPFDMRHADVFQDVEEKIDFIIHRKGYRRGVGVDAAELPTDVGFQFSINVDAQERKAAQVRQARRGIDRESPVDDIMLVVMRLGSVNDLKREWEDAGRPAGGPDKRLTREVARELFGRVLGGVLTPGEIDGAWGKFKEGFKEASHPSAPPRKRAA